jgi:hypothetical protein
MEKNKSAPKLKGFPHVLWINLDSQAHRREFQEEQFAYWEVDNTRISGIDGRDDDPSVYLKGTIPPNVNQGEIGCCLSHLKAIKYFIEETDWDEVIIAEDDLMLDTVKFWPFSWKEISDYFPYNFDCMQLSIINPAAVYAVLHNRFVNDFSAAVYVITRHHAQKIYKHHILGDKYRIDQDIRPRAVSEDLVFESGKCYAMPLFLYRLDMGSSIHPEHIEIFHRASYNGVAQFWNESNKIEDWKSLMNWDAYMGRLPPGFDVNGPIKQEEQQ